MSFVKQAVEAVTNRESAAPRTILGFLLGMYTVLLTGAVGTVVALASADSSGAIPYVLGFVAAITVALGVAILVITWKDPTRLMLGQITGREYAAIRRELTYGDDISGERKATVIEGPAGPAKVTSDTRALEIEAGPDADDREDTNGDR